MRHLDCLGVDVRYVVDDGKEWYVASDIGETLYDISMTYPCRAHSSSQVTTYIDKPKKMMLDGINRLMINRRQTLEYLTFQFWRKGKVQDVYRFFDERVEDREMDSSIEIKEENNELVVSSREVADNFGRAHRHVLDSVRDILAAENSAAKLFYESTYENRGKQYPMYLMNRDGFSLLVMGFAGKEALQWKLKYIAAFNAMEKSLRSMPSLPNFANPVEAARAWADAEEGRVKALDVVDDLQVKLGESMKWMSIKQVAKFNSLTYHDISWRKLKATGYETKDVYDANYGSVKAYSIEAWRKAYPDLELPQEVGA